MLYIHIYYPIAWGFHHIRTGVMKWVPFFFVGSNLMQRYGDLEHPVEKMGSSWSSWWSLLILLCAVWPQIFPSAPPNKAQLAARIVCIVYTYILYIYTVTSHAEALLNMSFGGFLCNLHVVKLFMRHALPYVTQSSSTFWIGNLHHEDEGT